MNILEPRKNFLAALLLALMALVMLSGCSTTEGSGSNDCGCVEGQEGYVDCVERCGVGNTPQF
jgi:hypothetical protein